MSIQQLNLNSFYDQSKQREMWMFEHVLVRAKMCCAVFAVLLALVTLELVAPAVRLRLAQSTRLPLPKVPVVPLPASHLRRR